MSKGNIAPVPQAEHEHQYEAHIRKDFRTMLYTLLLVCTCDKCIRVTGISERDMVLAIITSHQAMIVSEKIV